MRRSLPAAAVQLVILLEEVALLAMLDEPIVVAVLYPAAPQVPLRALAPTLLALIGNTKPLSRPAFSSPPPSSTSFPTKQVEYLPVCSRLL